MDIDALAAMTANYSGAEIKGLVGAAQSHALARYLKASKEKEKEKEKGVDETTDASFSDDAARVTMDDFSKALFEVRPALGADEEALDALRPLGTLCSCGTGTRERSPHKRARDALPPLLRAVRAGNNVAVADAD